jgi:hypothetical protein
MQTNEVAVNANVAVTEDGRVVVEEFLSGFTSLFIDIWQRGVNEGQWFEPIWVDDGVYRKWVFDGFSSQQITTRYTPRLFWNSISSGFYDANRNRINNAPWMDGSLYARSFYLLRLDDSGIPAILFSYGDFMAGDHQDAHFQLYRFIDGGFRRSTNSLVWWDEPNWSFRSHYFDSHGNLIGYYHNFNAVSRTYAYITFNNEAANLELIVSDGFGMAVGGYEFTHNLAGGGSVWVAEHTPVGARYIPGTNIFITPVEPMSLFEEEITTSIRQTLGLSD